MLLLCDSHKDCLLQVVRTSSDSQSTLGILTQVFLSVNSRITFFIKKSFYVSDLFHSVTLFSWLLIRTTKEG